MSGNAVKSYLFLNSVFQNGSRKATRADLADRLGISEEAVNDSLLELQNMQLITVGRSRYFDQRLEDAGIAETVSSGVIFDAKRDRRT